MRKISGGGEMETLSIYLQASTQYKSFGSQLGQNPEPEESMGPSFRTLMI